ncbi:AP endonuclease [Actinomadura sp. BRA 177]|uniref:AP endonuclease n=1 Tax=Actinomadura sp. BRA 177 TaxID=2745202 RepID=UPI0015957E08|nr:AP endonuclease [Actinomadura sp. BRA 177]NVI87513.1 AP endonuclease [Actinomadura sp. BRA 177]
MSGPAPVGLYSISVRGLEVPELLSWVARHNIPSVHLRGGSRGYDIAGQDAGTWSRWRQVSAATVPITGITADTDLADLISSDSAVHARAHDQVRRLANAARSLGAGWVRLLARHPLHRFPGTPLAEFAVPLLVELHHSAWLARRPHSVLLRLLKQQPNLRLLADSAQLSNALAQVDDGRADERLRQLAPWIGVLHLSDPGLGLTGLGHARVADHVIDLIADGQHIEVAVEWTGTDRAPSTALVRYQEAVTWWARRHATRWGQDR